MNTLVAVYGTLKKSHGNSHLLKDSLFIGKGKTEKNFALYRSGIPFVTKTEEVSPIVVEVYSVDESTLSNLDALEGHPNWYVREQTPIIMDEDGHKLNAYLYFNDEEVISRKEFLDLVETGNYV